MTASVAVFETQDRVANRPHLLTFLFGFCMFSTGASGLVNEYVLATITTYILGNSIEQFSIIIAAMMLMMGVSGLVQEKVSSDNLIEKFMGTEIAMALLGGFAPLAIYAAFGFVTGHFVFIHYFFILAIGFLIGFEIPIVMRIIEQHGVGLKKNLKVVYAMDYIGAFVGAIIWVKFLLKNFPLTEISFIVAGFNFFVALITIAYFMHRGVMKMKPVPIFALTFTGLALLYGYSHNREWNILMEQQFYEDPIVECKTTMYQHLCLTENKNAKDVRLYINGNTQFSSLDEGRYHDLLVHPAMTLVPYAHNVLVLGGGDGLALREILKYKDVDVTLVDLDPGMIAFSSSNPLLRKLNRDSLLNVHVSANGSDAITRQGVEGVYMEKEVFGSRTTRDVEWVASVHVYNVDADRFVGDLQGGRKWDVVIIDFPDPESIELAKLYSKEFYLKLKHLLAPGAMVAIQATSPYHAKEAYLTIKRTMEAAGFKTLPYRQNIPSFGDWGYFLAWTDDMSVPAIKDEISKIKEFRVETGFITPEVLSASLAFGKGELSSKETSVNTLMQPVLLSHYVDASWLVE